MIPKKEELEEWVKREGLTDFEDSEFLVNRIEIVDENTIRVKAFVNVYMKNKELYSAQIRFTLQKRRTTTNDLPKL